MYITLPLNSAKVITLSGLPTSVGQVNIPGCKIHCFRVITKHLFKDVDNLLLGAAQGLVLSDPFCCCGSPKLRNVLVPNIYVVLSLPSLVCHVVGGDGVIILYEGEIHKVRISLANAGYVPVEQAHLSLLGKNQDSVISIAYDTLKFALPLKPGPVTQPKQSSSNRPSMPPGRRLVVPLQVCVLLSLSFVKDHLLSMEILAHVSKTLPKLMFSESGNTEEIATSESRPDCLVKIDPYRGSYGNEDTTFIDRDAADFRSFLSKDSQTSEVSTSRTSSFSEKNMKAELNASIKSLISRIKLATIDSSKDSNTDNNLPSSKGSIFAYEMTPMEFLARNNTQEMITVNFSITCRDVARENCIKGNKATIFWFGKVS
ncbi:hypothetical protein GIB67_017742 [Kingdonia uniflora]|uniref:Uncharacterized protein n=1 Tax=Kingdonia uniflora TaxID=39325 RepID=A0A7J7LQ07_9MAGN|nr:hypothetical protein GIB67_017742 [Kingdonia uniflora]